MKALSILDACLLPESVQLYRRYKGATTKKWWPYNGRSAGPWFEYGINSDDSPNCEFIPTACDGICPDYGQCGSGVGSAAK